jgi:hypothetical protein
VLKKIGRMVAMKENNTSTMMSCRSTMRKRKLISCADGDGCECSVKVPRLHVTEGDTERFIAEMRGMSQVYRFEVEFTSGRECWSLYFINGGCNSGYQEDRHPCDNPAEISVYLFTESCSRMALQPFIEHVRCTYPELPEIKVYSSEDDDDEDVDMNEEN